MSGNILQPRTPREARAYRDGSMAAFKMALAMLKKHAYIRDGIRELEGFIAGQEVISTEAVLGSLECPKCSATFGTTRQDDRYGQAVCPRCGSHVKF